jgi:superfamily II DNA/RNA helicase
MPHSNTYHSRTSGAGRPQGGSNAGRPGSSSAGRGGSTGGRPSSGRPQRGQSAPVRSRAPKAKTYKVTPDSGLDRALAAVAALPAPDVKDFNGYGLPVDLVTVLARKGYAKPFAIQARSLPDALAGRDILARSQTGSGKTLAFGIPLIARLAGTRRTPKRPRGLVLVPTRELAEQVTNTLAPLGHAVDVRFTAVFGGSSISRQVNALERGIDVVVATPGRLVDLIERRALVLDDVEVTVLDEADYMADLGFLPVVTDLLKQCRPDAHRMLFSATLDKGVDVLVRNFLHDPAMHAHASDFVDTSTMAHRAFEVSREDRVDVAARIASRPSRTLFFVRTKHGADRLAKQLTMAGAPALAIHGNLRQSQRQKALDSFQRGESRVLVATDVAARGIHVDDVDLVVHFDLPDDHKDYLHRSGRTARAGAEGLVLSLVLPDQVRDARALYAAAGVDVTSDRVGTSHALVTEVAESGRAVVVLPRSRSEHSGSRTSSPQPASQGFRGGQGRGRGGRPSRAA